MVHGVDNPWIRVSVFPTKDHVEKEAEHECPVK